MPYVSVRGEYFVEFPSDLESLHGARENGYIWMPARRDYNYVLERWMKYCQEREWPDIRIYAALHTGRVTVDLRPLNQRLTLVGEQELQGVFGLYAFTGWHVDEHGGWVRNVTLDKLREVAQKAREVIINERISETEG